MCSATTLIDWFEINEPGDDTQVDTEIAQESEGGKGRLCCRACAAPITQKESSAEVMGKHSHVKINPQQQEFLIRCFADAPGCIVLGKSSQEHTWFDGYRWQFAHCRQCTTQLGWFFSGQKPFFGLIAARLIDCHDEQAQL